jgi:hypothetical protein
VNHDHITGAGIPQQRPQARPVGRGPGALVHIDPLGRDAELAYRVELPVKILLGR